MNFLNLQSVSLSVYPLLLLGIFWFVSDSSTGHAILPEFKCFL